MFVGSLWVTDILQMVNYLRKATDTLSNQTCQSLSSSWGDLHSHKFDTKCLNKFPLYLIRPIFSLDILCGLYKWKIEYRWYFISVQRHTFSQVKHASHSLKVEDNSKIFLKSTSIGYMQQWCANFNHFQSSNDIML